MPVSTPTNRRVPLVRLQLIRERVTTYPAALTGPAAAAALACQYLEDREREHFISIHLNAKHLPLALEAVAIGSANECHVSPAMVFRAALVNAAVAVILAHGHPSGNPEPSPEDRELTRVLLAAGELIGVKVLDHLVVGYGRWVSLREQQPDLWAAHPYHR